MTLRFLILISLMLAGCTHIPRSEAPPASVSAPPSRTVESFHFIGAATTLQDVIARLGAPDRDVGSGIYIYAYRLTDGSDVLVGSADGSHILYVRHGQDILFEKP
ncbi:MAG: hypothetical protein KDN19_02190 [Verrucomicrobiae bacterium]|nr:hypothetical protein [Verrucomicrobiae bacterium]